MEKKKFIINGKKFSDMTGFYNEVQLVLTKKFMGFGKNLDAFDDILYGGFGKFDENEEIVLIWKNFDNTPFYLHCNEKTWSRPSSVVKHYSNNCYRHSGILFVFGIRGIVSKIFNVNF